MTPDDTKQRLAAMDEAWKSAEADTDKSEKKEWTNPDDGEYQARVDRFDFHDGKGGLALRTQFELLGPSNAGWKVSTFHPLENPERLKWTKLHLQQLGIEASSLEELEVLLPKALDQVCDVALKTKRANNGKDYQNLYINKVVEGVTASASDPVSDAPPPHGDFDRPKPKDDLDDIPF